MSLFNLLSAIGPSAEQGYSARLIPNTKLHFVGRNTSGQPTILLGSKDAPHGLVPAIKLQFVEVQFAVLCRISLPDGKISEQRLSVIRCLSEDPDIQHYFLKVAATIVQLVGPAPAFAQVTGVLRRVVDLFQRLNRPAKREIVGLYGELLLLYWSSCAIDALRAWRSEPDDRFDFSIGEARIDVKTTSNRARLHTFALDQCRPAPGTTGFIASILLEPGTGASVGDLIDRIESRLTNRPDLVMKLHETVAETLGASLAEALGARFSDKAAKSSLKLFFSEDIPAPQGRMPTAVSEVRFKSDLSGLEARTQEEVASRSASAVRVLPLT